MFCAYDAINYEGEFCCFLSEGDVESDFNWFASVILFYSPFGLFIVLFSNWRTWKWSRPNDRSFPTENFYWTCCCFQAKACLTLSNICFCLNQLFSEKGNFMTTPVSDWNSKPRILMGLHCGWFDTDKPEAHKINF